MRKQQCKGKDNSSQTYQPNNKKKRYYYNTAYKTHAGLIDTSAI